MPRRFQDEEIDESQLTAENLANVRVKTPDRRIGEIFAIATKLLGGSRIEVACEDGVTRMARIPGKLRKRMWIREGDLLIVAPWEFQKDKSDIRWRYTKTQAVALSRRKLLPQTVDVF